MPYALDQPVYEKWPPYVVFKSAFTDIECGKIISMARDEQDATVGSDSVGVVDLAIRSSKVSWIHWGNESDWVYKKLEAIVNDVRQNWYSFHLSNFLEPLQLTHYWATENGHYDTHRDFGPGSMSRRKLSLVSLLSDPGSFSGGELEILGIPGGDKSVKEMSQGTVVVFPSWELHRVLKVASGERWSLVSWIHGHPYC